MKYIVFIIYDFEEPVHIKVMSYRPSLHHDWLELFQQEDISYQHYVLDAPQVVELLKKYKMEFDVSVDDISGKFYHDDFSDYTPSLIGGEELEADKN